MNPNLKTRVPATVVANAMFNPDKTSASLLPDPNNPPLTSLPKPDTLGMDRHTLNRTPAAQTPCNRRSPTSPSSIVPFISSSSDASNIPFFPRIEIQVCSCVGGRWRGG